MHAQRLVDAHRGIPSRIAYTKTRNGVTVVGNPKLSYHFPGEMPIVMVSITNGTVSEIELARKSPGQSANVPKFAYDISVVDSFSFSAHTIGTQ